ncbi:uncharacterized protein LOC118187178 [Stegodyphus dumicola]|uniref:uncharacterized protein LOC118187178 n=1 Tax=Stegodyphus dumicola TaxID=202533 RepID=UPI0015A9B791|nr:uncharacterized protein LOC118187178 [Stegodyphus dumicola]
MLDELRDIATSNGISNVSDVPFPIGIPHPSHAVTCQCDDSTTDLINTETMPSLLEDNNVPKISYANAVAKVPRKNNPTILLYPKQELKCHITEKLNQILPLKEINANIDYIANIKNGGIAISSTSKEELNKITNAINVSEEANNLIEIKTPRVKKPKISINNIPNTLPPKLVLEELVDQLRIDKEEISPLFYTKGKNPNTIKWVLECSPRTLSKCIERRKIIINWSILPIAEFYGVRRCYRCQDFSHSGSACKFRTYCAFCGGPHSIRNCKEDVPDCINCKLFNCTYGTYINTSHAAFPPKCPLYQREISKIKAAAVYTSKQEDS